MLTADVLFKGTVGGTRAPGATGFADLKSSVMDKLMTLPPETRIHPGHREPSTIGDRVGAEPVRPRLARARRRGLRAVLDRAAGRRPSASPATLVLWAPDYDGGNKAWVRFEDGSDAIVGGSQVKRES